MSIFAKSDKTVVELAMKVLQTHESHKPLIEVGVKFDFLTARAAVDEHNMPTEPALTHNGAPALGIARIVPIRMRALGNGDACVDIDGDFWIEATDQQRMALLDHELHHIALRTNEVGNPVFDYLERPVLRMRKHTHDYGWFDVVAQRNGEAAIECMQARKLMEQSGQLYWPNIGKIITVKKVSESVVK